MTESQIKQMLNDFKYVCGKKQTLKMILESSANIGCIVIAQDAEEHIIQSAIDVSKIKGVKYVVASTKKALGLMVNIKIGCSMICFYN